MKGGSVMSDKYKIRKKRVYLDDKDAYIEILERYIDLEEEDIPELDNARSPKDELEVIREVLEEDIRDITS